MCCGDYDTSGNPSRKSIVLNLVDYKQFSACRLICEIHCKNIFKDAEDDVTELKQSFHHYAHSVLSKCALVFLLYMCIRQGQSHSRSSCTCLSSLMFISIPIVNWLIVSIPCYWLV